MIAYLTIEAMIKRPSHFIDLFKACNLPMVRPNLDLSFE